MLWSRLQSDFLDRLAIRGTDPGHEGSQKWQVT